jgi:hypothetical protein
MRVDLLVGRGRRSIPVSLVNSGKTGVIAFDQGWIAPASVIVCPANCFQSIAALE